jgi:hypothetical protein
VGALPTRGGCAAAGWAPVRRARDRWVSCAWQGAVRRHGRCCWWHAWATDGSRPSIPGGHPACEAAGESKWGRACGAGGRSLGAERGASRAVVALDARRSRSVRGMVREPVPGVGRPASGVGGVAVWRGTRGGTSHGSGRAKRSGEAGGVVTRCGGRGFVPERSVVPILPRTSGCKRRPEASAARPLLAAPEPQRSAPKVRKKNPKRLQQRRCILYSSSRVFPK